MSSKYFEAGKDFNRKLIENSDRGFEFCCLFQDYYRPFELTVVGDLFTFKEVSHSVRDYMPHCCTDYRYSDYMPDIVTCF